MRHMLDCAYLPHEIPPCDVLAGYLPGGSVSHAWSADDWARARLHAGYILPIHVAAYHGDAIAGANAGRETANQCRNLTIGEGCAVVLDIEHEAVAHVVDGGYAAAWVGAVATAGFHPVIYASATDRARVAKLADLWLASWGKPAQLLTGTVATQYDGGPGKAFDQSVVSDKLTLAHTGKGGGNVPQPTKTAMVAVLMTRTGKGYYEVNEDGAVYALGDAVYHGGANSPDVTPYTIVGAALTPSGGGYVLIDSNGGVYCYGDAEFHGAVVGGVLHEGK